MCVFFPIHPAYLTLAIILLNKLLLENLLTFTIPMSVQAIRSNQ